jgi:hypothetical protein
MTQDSGRGAVIQKNMQLETWEAVDCLYAIKHGNGKDWWVIAKRSTYQQGTNLNEWYLYLVDATGIYAHPFQVIGSANSTSIGNLVFDKVHNKLLFTNYKGLIELYDFDRCTGLLTNPTNIDYQARAILGLEIMDDYSNLRIRNPKSTYTSKSLRANIFYPNPARDEIFINYIGVNDCAVEIYDMTGRLIFKQTLPDKKISVKSLSPGSYIFKLINGKKILAEELINVIK